ncbi:BTAD domain-containing putative transcriptional regulator [Streptomyces sp. t39]|uniref:AfsR/SARP family transcriptional regulator n=1 Tax=Streptomyces sp. t39 TaxID=1828156 RepID=UPI0011CE93A2|nr:BTAD domain-containing putative transcriptional regulator [Streptomyces sp. t39]TXS55692.1 transcriptional regulator [Streptomyces sp. t39]
MRFRILGPLDIRTCEHPVRIARGNQQTVAALLLAAQGRVVAVPALTREIWGEDVPTSAVPNLRTYVMRLRRSASALADRLTTSASGYALRVEPDELDLSAFGAAAEAGRRALNGSDAAAAAAAFDRALAHWRGRPLENVPLGPALSDLAQSLGEEYAQTVEDRAEAGLALGDHHGVIARLRPFAELHPLRERAHRHLMLAHYRAGDVDAALRVYRQVRQALRTELGIDPGRELALLQQAVLARDPQLDGTPGPACGTNRPAAPGDTPPKDLPRGTPAEQPDTGGPLPRQLPPAPALFVGRGAELTRIGAALAPGAGPVVVAVHGPGGFGKSALALRAAHAVSDHYPGGQLYADLQGASHRVRALAPAEVLGRFLRALGVDRSRIPAGSAEAAALYQSLLAERRVLIVLDNVAHAAQVRSLLPAGRGCGALVTGRAVLSALDAEQIALRGLCPAASVAMLTLQAGEERAAAEPEALAAIARECGGHALALRIAGARLAARPDLPVSCLAERLARRRLAEWTAGDLDLSACFAAGYEKLTDPAAARAFRILGRVHPGGMHLKSAAVWLGSDMASAEAALDELVAARLLESLGHGHFRMHRLLRLYAAELPEPGWSRARAGDATRA